MTLGEKVRYLREVEGTLQGLDRALTQNDVVRATGISQAYLSQIENGRRRHLTDSSRMLLARFFNVHPGYLVSDPEGYQTELTSPVRADENRLDLWLINGAEQFSHDREIGEALLALARAKDSRKCLLLMAAILELPDLADRLFQVLQPEKPRAKRAAGGKRK